MSHTVRHNTGRALCQWVVQLRASQGIVAHVCREKSLQRSFSERYHTETVHHGQALRIQEPARVSHRGPSSSARQGCLCSSSQVFARQDDTCPRLHGLAKVARLRHQTANCPPEIRSAERVVSSRSAELMTPQLPRWRTWVYSMVVLTSLRPRHSCTVQMSYPAASQWVANACRRG